MKVLILADGFLVQESFALEIVYEEPSEDNYFLWDDRGLSFICKKRKLFFDFLDEKIKFRLNHLSRKNELLFRALNLKLGDKVLDLSAGSGIDSFIIANFGFEILMIERNWIIYLLLKDALRRIKEISRFENLKLNLKFGEAINYLKNTYPVIYFDPMFPLKNKKALNQEKMRIFTDLVGNDHDALQVARLAYQNAHRLVIKRPRVADSLLEEKKPNLIYRGKNHRFDVYFN